MGDYNQAIIDVEVTTAEHARELASDVLAWLIAEQIIEDRLCDGCLGEGACYPPGPRFMQACGGKEDAALNGNYAEFSRMATNGLKVLTGRSVVCNHQGEFGPVACPECAAFSPIDKLWEAGEIWFEHKGDTMTCDSCGRASMLSRWIHPDVGFLVLAFQFWNWSPLSDEFIAAVGARLGNRVATITGKV